NKKILFTHGDIYLPTIDNYLKNIPFFLKKILFKFSKYEKKHYQRTIFYLKKTKSALTKDNLKIIKKFKKTNYKNKINWLITGHSHNPIISKKFHYIDVGFFEENFHSYLEISYQGIFNLITKNKNLIIKQKI
ncbi:MAG: hypothetical protein NZM02_01050, partial [Patescibacteria group bacterium]|nr:hypothetical protein [Patescibacteria group bacterium]